MKSLLVKGGYLSAHDIARLHFEKYQLGNVSASDPADTTMLRMIPNPPNYEFIVMAKGGDGESVQKKQLNLSKAPPRTPACLPP